MPRTTKCASVEDHDFDEEPQLEGLIVGIGKMVVDDKGREAGFITVATEDAQHRVWESFDLADVFKNAVVGDRLKLKFLRMVPTKAGKQMRQFRYSLTTE